MSLVPGCNNSVVSRAQLYQYANAAGFSGAAADTIVAIAFAESGGNTCSYNPSDPFGGSFGVLQINGAHFGANMSRSCALDPACAFRFAHGLYAAQGFRPWGTFTNGSYKTFLQAGQATKAPGSTPAPSTGVGATPASGNVILDQLKLWGEYIAIFLLAIGLIVIGFLLLGGQQVAKKVGI